MEILSYRRWKLWTRLLLDWLDSKFNAVASSIDFTTVNEKIDGVGSKVDALDEKITPYLYDECSNEDIDRMFETTTEDGQIIIPSELITDEGTMPASVFSAITGLTPTE